MSELSKRRIATLKVEQMKFAQFISEQEWECVLDTEVLRDFVTGALIYELNATLAGKRQTEVVATVPRDWWQHFKQRWFPAWMIKRFPVVNEDIVKTTRRMCPHLATDSTTEHVGFLLEEDEL